VLSRVANDHPGIYIKSLATTLGEMQDLEIILTATGRQRAALEGLLEAAAVDLREGLTALGIGHREKEPSYKQHISG